MSHVSSFNGLTGNLTSDDIAYGAGAITVATSSTSALATDVTGDTVKRLNIDGSGKHTWGSGSATGDTTLYRSAADTLKTDDAFVAGAGLTVTTGGATVTAGDVTATNGNVIIGTAGKGLQVKTGSNAKAGTGTANGTSAVTISTTAVTANSLIFLGYNGPAGTPAPVYVSAVTPGTSFAVKSSASDTSVFAWMIVEPAA